MTEQTAGLIPCPTCQHQIGTQADNCPKCGSPNTWTHPRIQAMYETKTFNTARSFRFWHKGAEVWGESAHHSVFAYLGAILIILFALISAVFTFFLGPIIGGVVVAVFWRATARKDTFRANLASREWTSNNDQFWQPVAKFLQLK